jgi:hypothetical protein
MRAAKRYRKATANPEAPGPGIVDFLRARLTGSAIPTLPTGRVISPAARELDDQLRARLCRALGHPGPGTCRSCQGGLRS